MESINDFLIERRRQGLLRMLHPVSLRKGACARIGGRDYIDFSSNDYLGLSRHPKLIAAAQSALTKYGAGASASRLLSGSLDIHEELEARTAHFKNKESALVFNSGYQANIGIISSFCEKGDVIFCDRYSHASIIDGAVLSGAKTFRFAHNDIKHLEELLKKERDTYKNSLIITETIFSMDGDRSDLKALVQLKNKYKCALLVDEAHATGIFGRTGSGLVEEEGLTDEVEHIMGTFSKALGSFGAYLAASKESVQYLINRCRSFIYSTALPAAVISANLAGIKLVEEEPWRRKKLLELAKLLRDGLKREGFVTRGDSQIVPLIIGDNERTIKLAKLLQEKGYWALPIRPPTIPKGQSRIRLSLTCDMDEALVEKLLLDIKEVNV